MRRTTKPIELMLISLQYLRDVYSTNNGRQAARNLTHLVVFRILGQMAAVAIVLLLTRALSHEQFGACAIALGLQPYLAVLACSGIRPVAVRELSQGAASRDEVFTSYVSIVAPASTVVCGLTLVGVTLLPLSGPERVLLCLMAIGNIAASMDLQPFFDAAHRQRAWGTIAFGSDMFVLACLAVLWRYQVLTLTTLGIILASKWGLVVLVQHGWFMATASRLHFVRPSRQATAMLRPACLVSLSRLVSLVPLGAGIFFVRAYHGSGAAGTFGIASQIAAAFLVLAAVGQRVFQPHVAGPYGMERSFIRKLIVFQALFLGTLLTVAVAGSVVLIILLLPLDYRAAFWPTMVLLTGALTLALAHIPTMYLIALGNERAILRVWLAAALIYVVAAILLVPSFSVIGAAFPTLGAGVIVLVLMTLAARGSLLARLRTDEQPPAEEATCLELQATLGSYFPSEELQLTSGRKRTSRLLVAKPDELLADLSESGEDAQH